MELVAVSVWPFLDVFRGHSEALWDTKIYTFGLHLYNSLVAIWNPHSSSVGFIQIISR